jgi:hypothetical protein
MQRVKLWDHIDGYYIDLSFLYQEHNCIVCHMISIFKLHSSPRTNDIESVIANTVIHFSDINHLSPFCFKQCFGNWTLPLSSVKKPTLLDPIDRACSSLWTLDPTQSRICRHEIESSLINIYTVHLWVTDFQDHIKENISVAVWTLIFQYWTWELSGNCICVTQ